MDPVERKKLAKKEERRVRKLKRKAATGELEEAKPQNKKVKVEQQNGKSKSKPQKATPEAKLEAPVVVSASETTEVAETKSDTTPKRKRSKKKKNKSPGQNGQTPDKKVSTPAAAVTNGKSPHQSPKGKSPGQSPNGKSFKKMKK